MQLRCRQCRAELRARDVDARDLVARCRRCGWSFGAGATPYRLATRGEELVDEPEPSRRPSLPRPAAVDVDERGEGAFTIRYRRGAGWRVAAITLVLLCLFPAAVAYGVTSSLPLLSFFVVVGGVLAYLALVSYFNHVVLEAADGWLRVGGTPIPALSRRYRISSISQLYVGEGLHPTRDDDSFQYALRARVAGSDVVLVSSIARPLHALYLEQELERRLSIEDRPIEGEYEPPHLGIGEMRPR
jgi:hypothetical protein